MSDQAGFNMSDQFNPAAMQALMRQPELYWPSRDALAPAPESVDFIEHMLHPDVWTLAATARGHIIGYVQFTRRTSVMIELTVGFHPQWRGRVAKAMTQNALGLLFREKRALKVIACVPSDNRVVRWSVNALGFKLEATLNQAIVRQRTAGLPLADVLIYSLSRGDLQ